MLYYQHCPKYLEEIKQFVVPRAHRRTALNGCHQDAGHQGKKWTLSLVADRFWWPGVQEAVENAVCDCKHCQVYEGSESKAPMVSLKVTNPLQLVHLDLTSFESTMDLGKMPEVKNILVIVDHFTRCVRAYVTKDQKASTVTKCLYEGFISIFGTLEKIITDQGKALLVIGHGVVQPIWSGQNYYNSLPSPGKWTGGTNPPNLGEHDWEIGG